MADTCDRLRNNILSTLHRELADKKVIIVSHGDVMRALRVTFDRIMADEYHALDIEDPAWFKIGNGQVIHYTRVDPFDSKHVLPHMGWVRSVNPFDPNFAGHDWKEVVHKTYTNEELLALANRSTRIINC